VQHWLYQQILSNSSLDTLVSQNSSYCNNIQHHHQGITVKILKLFKKNVNILLNLSKLSTKIFCLKFQLLTDDCHTNFLKVSHFIYTQWVRQIIIIVSYYENLLKHKFVMWKWQNFLSKCLHLIYMPAYLVFT
jgi:hypothetical protein